MLIGVLALPALQARFPVFKMGRLGGYAQKAPAPVFSWAGLLDNSYQLALEKYVEDRIGFRVLLVRVRNQLTYSLFRVARASQVVVGDDDILFEEGGIRAYLGQDFKGNDVVRLNVRRLKAVQDTLAKRGILLVFAIAPGKANFYSDHFPSYFKRQPRTTTNYAAYAKQMQAQGVNLIDLAQAFQRWKDTASYPLFPRGGVHWSGYGIPLAADSLFRYIEQRGHFDLPDYAATGPSISNHPRDSDNDAAQALNVLWEPPAYLMNSPDVAFRRPKSTQQRPNLLVVGDSFVYGLIGFYPYIPSLFSDKTQFWYYNNIVEMGARADMPLSHEVALLDRKKEILAQDVILLLYNQQNLVSFDNGFSADAYAMFFPLTAADQVRIQALEQELQQSPVVQDKLWEQATTTGKDYNQLLHETAVAEYELRRP